jgi:hypothetical protein
MCQLEFLHAVQEFLGRDIEVDSADEKSVYEMYEEGDYTVQLAAELLMTPEDFAWVYGTPYSK